MTSPLPVPLPGGDVPQHDRLVAAAARDLAVVAAAHRVQHLEPVPHVALQLGALARVPELEGLVAAAGHHVHAVHREAHSSDGSLLAVQL